MTARELREAVLAVVPAYGYGSIGPGAVDAAVPGGSALLEPLADEGSIWRLGNSHHPSYRLPDPSHAPAMRRVRRGYAEAKAQHADRIESERECLMRDVERWRRVLARPEASPGCHDESRRRLRAMRGSPHGLIGGVL